MTFEKFYFVYHIFHPDCLFYLKKMNCQEKYLFLSKKCVKLFLTVKENTWELLIAVSF